MSVEEPLSTQGRLYVKFVIVCGVVVVLHSLTALWNAPVNYQWFVLAGLTLLSGSFTVRIPTISARLSVSETFVFAAVLLFGPAAATIIVVLDTLVISLWLRAKSRQPARILFNMAAPSVAIWVAAQVFFFLADIQPLSHTPQQILSLIIPLFALALCYFLLNSLLVAAAVAFERKAGTFSVWRQNFLWLSLNYFSGASVAALLLPYLQSQDSEFIKIIGIILPLLLISYLTFKTALGRVEDANSHLTALNRLYLSTIETLAMAIDAKDQITHGHIRRVQLYAVRLAKAMGVDDPSMIKAIEAAALLHDMGKLAVPEYILNKPGPLTAAEFERMKLHASVGADILSAIDFPYPVVPIVRHHHESWDGSGYPAGLKGSDIPIGARILSVVDCFDALTSDRPYRPRLADKEALRILESRRGSMYDPLVVDTFTAIYADITDPSETPATDPSLRTITESIHRNKGVAPEPRDRFEQIAASRSETLALLQLSQDLHAARSVSDVADAVFRHTRRLIPTSLMVLYLVDEVRHELYAANAIGDHATLVSGLRIPLGHRLSGWIAANKHSIRNSDPLLDLGDAARDTVPRLRSSMGNPIVQKDTVVGVLTLYSAQPDAFTEDHERVLDAIARRSAEAIKTVVSPLSRIRPHIDSEAYGVFVYVQIAQVDQPHTRSVGEAATLGLVESLAGIAKSADRVNRPTPNEVTVVLRGPDAASVMTRAEQFSRVASEYWSTTGEAPFTSVHTASFHVTSEMSESTLLGLARRRSGSAPRLPSDPNRNDNDSVH
jgi:putative nucleotidyltransferase with HDIG domain